MDISTYTRILSVVAFCVTAFMTTPTLDAKDFVTLRSGELFTGRVLRVSNREVSIQLDSGAFVSFQKQRVKKVQRYLPGQDLPEIIDFDEVTDLEPAQPETGAADRSPISPISPIRSTESEVETSSENPGLIGSALSKDPPTGYLDVAVSDSDREWTFRVPSGFEPWHPDARTEIVEAWIDPVTQAIITISVHPRIGTGEDYRSLTLGALQRKLQPRIFRDQPIKDREDAEKPNGWLLDTEQSIAGNATRQLHLFVNRESETYILRCSSPAEIFKKYVDHFEECVRSFQIHSSTDAQNNTEE